MSPGTTYPPSGSHTCVQEGYFPFLANRKKAQSAPNKISLKWPFLKALGNSNCSSASRCEGPQKNRQLLLHSSLQNGKSQCLLCMAVNIDPPVKNKGAVSVWQQINKKEEKSGKRNIHVRPIASSQLLSFFSLCVAQRRRCLFGCPPFRKEVSGLSAFRWVQCQSPVNFI